MPDFYNVNNKALRVDKKEKEELKFFLFYGRFLSIVTMTAPTIAMATIIAAPIARTYVSVIGFAVSAIGVAEVCGASSTCNAVSANELPYESEPA